MLLGLYILGKRSNKSPVLRRVLGIGRVLVYGSAVAGTLGFFTMRSAIADFREQTLQIGHDIAGMTDLLGTTAEIMLNGEAVNVSTATTDQPLTTVLDRFEASCNDSPGPMKDVLDKVLNTPQGKVAAKAQNLSPFGVQRTVSADGKEGTVLCFANPNGKSVEWRDALKTLRETGDLGALGNFRYVYVVRQGNGKSAIRTIWTEGHFNLDRVMPPAEGDAPGSDEARLPRPQNARRLFTATATSTSYAARFYETGDSPAQALEAYDGSMTKLGWKRVALTETLADAHWYLNPETLEQSVFQATPDAKNAARTTLIVGTVGIAAQAPSAEKLGVLP